MKVRIFYLFILSLSSLKIVAQSGGGSTSSKLIELPDIILPAPEAAAIIKANNLSVGYSTGAANINIPIVTLSVGSYSLPISLNYSSTGIKVDETASMVGMGWNLDYGGVISRTVLGRPDETRSTGTSNFSNPNFGNKDQALLDFLNTTNDLESDIFNFSFPGFSGKFILDANKQPIQLSKKNLKIEVINGLFTNGFIIRTDDGTAYHFEDAEISKNRNPSGLNCGKTYDGTEVITSWFLTKIVLPSTQKQITFTYSTVNTTFNSSFSESVSKIIASETYPCTPSGPVCPVGEETFKRCINEQLVASKYISQIQTSEGDKIIFNYEVNSREDFQSAKKLDSLNLVSRTNVTLKTVEFNTSYQLSNAANGAASNYYNLRRLFLENVKIKGQNVSATAPYLQYTFAYQNYTNLPPRFSFAQDFYGYYNGKNSNSSLLHQLDLSDPNKNYSFSSFSFGDRSIDPVYSANGMLTKITYPTGGYDDITYTQNKYIAIENGVEIEKYTGGVSVQKITSYTFAGSKALEKEFVYRNLDNNKLSSYIISSLTGLSIQRSVKTSGYVCNSAAVYEGPSCTYAIINSNPEQPLSSYSGQHIYFQTVLEYAKNGSNDNGLVEHKYSYAMNLDPSGPMGSAVPGTSFNIVPDIVRAETFTNIYKNDNGTYKPVKTTERQISNGSFSYYTNYIVRKNYSYTSHSSPPTIYEFGPYDVSSYNILVYTVQEDVVIEKSYQTSTNSITVQTDRQYHPTFNYPVSIKTTGSDGLESKVDYTYSAQSATRNIIKLTEEKFYKNNTLLQTRKSNYTDWFSDDKVHVLQSVELIKSGNTVDKILYSGYDNNGNVLEVAKENDQKFTYLWDETKTFPVAKVINAGKDVVAYTSFEGLEGSWTGVDGSAIFTGPSITGRKFYTKTGFSISKSGLNTSSSYIVTYWSKNGAYTIPGSVSGYPILLKTSVMGYSTWNLYKHVVTGQSTITVTGNGSIDELRLYPLNAQMISYAYQPIIGIVSEADANNKVTYYHYDGFGRLFLITDEDRNVVKKICYNYSGQTEDCNVSVSPVWINTATSPQCKTNNLFQNTGEVEQEQVDNNPFSPTYGQTQWIVTGTNTTACPLPSTCNSGNCSGVNKKCVGNTCQTGIKIYTNSEYDPVLRKWICTYHYEWSDGSWSQNYQEIKAASCGIS